MTDSNRDELLANFQGCTGIEDVGVAIMLLEEANWDLVAAVKKVLPHESNLVTRPFTLPSSSNGGVPVTLSSDFAEAPSTSIDNFSPIHIIEIYVHYGSEVVKLHVPDYMDYAGLQMMIFSETGLPPCSQNLTGWTVEPSGDTVKLCDLNMPIRTNLFLLPALAPEPYDHSREEILHIIISDGINNRDYNLRLPGQTTVGDIMRRTFILTSIPVVYQVWHGWPPGYDESLTIGVLGLTRPAHRLMVHSSNEHPNSPPATVFIDLTESDSSPEDFEDASESFTGEEEIFHDNTPTRRSEPLIPDNVEDETAGSVHFIDGFTRRYGQSVPNFLPGSLEEAIREACLRPAREGRILAVYLHHDGSVLSNVFCTEILGSETVLQTFGNYFVLWGWDLTNDANRNMFLASTMKNLDSHVAETVRNMSTEQLPALMLLTRTRSNTELFNVIYGNIGLNDFLGLLMHAVDLCTEMQENEIKEEEERAARERIKSEQDHAFQQSLLMDRAKEEARKKQQQLDSEEELRRKQQREAEEKKKNDERAATLARIPEEPAEGTPDVIKIKFRCPTGGLIERRFLFSDELQTLFNVLFVNGFPVSEYKIISSWPRRDLSIVDPSSPLQSLSLHTQETLILEER